MSSISSAFLFTPLYTKPSRVPPASPRSSAPNFVPVLSSSCQDVHENCRTDDRHGSYAGVRCTHADRCARTIAGYMRDSDHEITVDTEVLNFALSLEHLENAFYTSGLSRFSEKDFEDDGLPSWVRGRFVQIAEHEAEHARLLNSVLGDQAIQPCDYKL